MATQIHDALRAFYDRRHPEYNARLAHWLFLKAAYRGGREWFASNIFKYHKEGQDEFDKRVERAYRFNHTREVVDLVQKYLFKAGVHRNVDQAPEPVKEFWKKTTLTGLDIDQFMRSSSSKSSIGGRVAIVTDNNLRVEIDAETGRPRQLSVEEAKLQKARIYSYVVEPEDVLDYSWDEEGDGGLNWIKLREWVRDDADPLYSDGCVREQIRLWTRTDWILYKEVPVVIKRRGMPAQETIQVQEISRQAHDLGYVPVDFLDHMIGDFTYNVPGLIDDIAYLDRAVTNYLSNLDAIIQDQTFSQLAMPAAAVPPGQGEYNKLLELGTKRMFIYDAGAGTAKPEFLSPDPKQAGVIQAVIAKIINEIYHTIGLAGERTKEDNSQGIDNSSGVAKAYDFERVNSLLMSKASGCEHAENLMVEKVCRWAGIEPPKEKLVTYPTTFDVMRLADELVTAESLGKLMAPAEVRREQMKALVDKIFPQLKQDLKEKIQKSIEEWLTDKDPSFAPPTAFGTSTAAPSRQGQVTKDTPAKKPANQSA